MPNAIEIPARASEPGEIECCDRSMLDCAARLRSVLAVGDRMVALRLAEELYDLSSVHGQAEFDTFLDAGCLPIPHDVVDDTVHRVRAAVINHAAPVVVADLLDMLARLLLAEIDAGGAAGAFPLAAE